MGAPTPQAPEATTSPAASASATPMEPERAPTAAAPEASATRGGPQTPSAAPATLATPETVPAASAETALPASELESKPETAPAASRPDTAPAASATQAELETSPAASKAETTQAAAAVAEAATEATMAAEVGGASETPWWGKWTEAEWKAWHDGTWWDDQYQRPDWSARKHTHSTPPESAAGTPMKGLQEALSRMSTVDLEATPKADPATPPPPATPGPTPAEKKEAAKRAHARYMRYYRSTLESAGLQKNTCLCASGPNTPPEIKRIAEKSKGRALPLWERLLFPVVFETQEIR